MYFLCLLLIDKSETNRDKITIHVDVRDYQLERYKVFIVREDSNNKVIILTNKFFKLDALV